MQDVHGGNVWKWQKIPGQRLLDFSASINPMGPPKGIFRIIIENLPNLVHYPDPESREACQALSEYLAIEPYHIILVNGAMELLYLLPRSLSLQSALIPIPTFSGYEKALLRQSGRPNFIDWWRTEETQKIFTNPLKPGPDNLARLKQALGNTQGIFICHPNNPTGEVLEKEFFLNLLDFCEEQNLWMIVDEAFIDFLDRPEDYSLIQEAVCSTRLVVIRSLTKFFALPGLRLGYGVGPRAVIERLKEEQPPWSVNVLAQQVVHEILKDKTYIQQSREFIKEERLFLLRVLSELEGIRPLPSMVNFFLCQLTREGLTAPRLTALLAEMGILIRDCSTFRGLNHQYFRAAIRTREENLRLLSALQKI